MRRALVAALLAAAITAGNGLAGCSGSLAGVGSGSRTHRSAVPRSLADPYLRLLGEAQARLSAAERTIPVRPSSVTALAAAVTQLAQAIGRLEEDLRQIKPPGAIRADHAGLIATVEQYRTALLRIAAQARGPAQVAAVGARLVATTSSASAALGTEQSAIEQRLGK